jgi:DNA-binding transcriptional MerR regulator/methylmalonyl-CoA mutase cobalamin-binding subunit
MSCSPLVLSTSRKKPRIGHLEKNVKIYSLQIFIFVYIMSVGRSKSDAAELTYPVGTAARLTGLSPEVIRAWERRYGVVEPLRTPGGTRRYRASDLRRLRLVKAAVDAGHRIGQVARLETAELEQRAARSQAPSTGRLDEILSALERLDGAEAHRLLSLQLSALGPARFGREIAAPLAREIGERWAGDRLPIASEHLATAVLRSLLGSALQPTAASLLGPRIVFATPTGEQHELGLQIAALAALAAGANTIYLGADLPVQELLDSVQRVGAAALALSLVALPNDRAARTVGEIRSGLPDHVYLWLGGAAASALEPRDGVDCIDSLEAFEQRVALLGFESTNGR